MRTFYKYRADHPGASKAECLQESQLALLRGTVSDASTSAPARRPSQTPKARGDSDDAADDDTVDNLPDFDADQSKPFAHPYYCRPATVHNPPLAQTLRARVLLGALHPHRQLALKAESVVPVTCFGFEKALTHLTIHGNI